jgi:hypothetical protein
LNLETDWRQATVFRKSGLLKASAQMLWCPNCFTAFLSARYSWIKLISFLINEKRIEPENRGNNFNKRFYQMSVSAQYVPFHALKSVFLLQNSM